MRNVFLITWKESLSIKFWKFFVGSAGPLIAILLVGKNFFNLEPFESFISGLLFFVCVWVIVFFIFLSKNIYKHWISKLKDSLYGEAIIELKDAFSKIHWFNKIDDKSDELFISTMSFVCDQLKKIYDGITNSKCHVSIKVAPSNELKLETPMLNLCRDKGARWRDNEAYKKTSHQIFANEPYKHIFIKLIENKRSQLFYINNDIPGTKDYSNTSKETYKDGILPYKSELVIPIIPVINDEQNEIDSLGFLCIDCEETNKFQSKYALPIIQGVADGIYEMLKSRRKI